MTNNPYHSFDPTRTAPVPTPYGFPPTSFSPYDDMSAASAYCPTPTTHPSAYSTACPPLHSSPFFAAAAAAAAAAAVGSTNMSAYQRHDDTHVE